MYQNALHDDTLVTSNFRLWLSHPLVDSNSAGNDSFFPFLNTELFSFHCVINVEFDAEESERCLNGCRRINRSYWNRYCMNKLCGMKPKVTLSVSGFYMSYIVYPLAAYLQIFQEIHLSMYLNICSCIYRYNNKWDQFSRVRALTKCNSNWKFAVFFFPGDTQTCNNIPFMVMSGYAQFHINSCHPIGQYI